jgi:hypothetical protein
MTHNDKIRYKLAFDRRPLLTLFADKHAVRQYVADRVGPEILNEVYQVVEDPGELDLASLPDRFVVKPTHGSAAVIIVHDEADPDAEIPVPRPDGTWTRAIVSVRKDRLDRRRFDALCRDWLARTYQPHEWAYRNVPPRLLVEQFLESPDGGLPRDYKLRVFHGKVAWLQAHVDKSSDHRMSLHWPDWTPIPAQGRYPRPDVIPEPPGCLAEMIRISEALGAETDMVRVDLYEVGDRVVFGELTNYPTGGTAAFQPEEYNEILGRGWNPPATYE